jgi:hypothetical protein
MTYDPTSQCQARDAHKMLRDGPREVRNWAEIQFCGPEQVVGFFLLFFSFVIFYLDWYVLKLNFKFKFQIPNIKLIPH